ncbi:MAG TPA: NAD(P)H-binding protein [Cyclobacteriaceae bacterium]|nr:NAD(P)H-binding protein [Cyclobacteriaceae bacterium]
MNIIVGATGQVGSQVIQQLKQQGYPVRAVVRNKDKLADPSMDWRRADLMHEAELVSAFEGGTSAFVLTPENPASKDILGDTERIVSNYVKAIRATGIQKVVALSCVGAHVDGKTGNVLMSRMLEQELAALPVEKTFIRPSYYFSNWTAYRDSLQADGLLPSFFPEELKIDMHSPIDLAAFVAQALIAPTEAGTKVYELTGPEKYSVRNVAHSYSAWLNRKIAVHFIPRKQWRDELLAAGFTDNTAENLSDMTQAVIEGLVVPEHPEKAIKLPTSLSAYLEEQVNMHA